MDADSQETVRQMCNLVAIYPIRVTSPLNVMTSNFVFSFTGFIANVTRKQVYDPT